MQDEMTSKSDTCVQGSNILSRPHRMEKGKTREPHGRAHGFMLLEVMIAFVIATLALSAMIGVAAGSLRASLIAARYNEATVRAQSRLAEAINGGTLMPGEWEGSDGGGYRWRITVAPAAGDSAVPLALYAVSISISWREGGRTRDVRLDTERIGEITRPP
jgi:general secretion pathway protein I